MAEFEAVEGTETPTEDEVQPVAGTGDVPSGDTVSEGAEPSAVDPSTEPEKPAKSPVQARIDELTRKRREAEQGEAYWRGRAEAAEEIGKSRPPESKAPQTPSSPPTAEQFDTDEEYQEARIEYAATKAATETATRLRGEYVEERQRAAAEDERNKIMEALDEEGLRDQANEVGAPASNLALYAARDDPAAFVRYLIANPERAKRIIKLPDVDQVREVGKIMAELELKPPKKTTNAPGATTTVGPGLGSPPAKTEATRSFQENLKIWEAERLKKAKAGVKP